MAPWNAVSQVSSIAQLAGVDAYGLISMIVDAARTVKRNWEICQLLARRARMIGDLLQQLKRTQLMQHMETRNPVEQLEETLRHAYVLIASCRDAAVWGVKRADQLREVQNEITFYLQLFPLVSFVDNTRTWERLLRRACPLCSRETTDDLHAVHHAEHEDRSRTEALMANRFENLGTHPPSKSKEEKTEVLLEIISGKLIRSYKLDGKGHPGLPLPDHAHKYQTELHKLVDPLLRAKEHESSQIMECLKVVLLCIHHLAKQRPTMSEVVTMIGSINVAPRQ
ncbi:G-type lectin S-receptor-like serine/threonine-protein kinase SD1-13 [Panicum miliaceum]|uniref:G-type lectin S-receptor-like serine/threonine-protein kinase SD1-13 n=1 Tax=Panicum miliaceum TaxID=4540 RepID=A0A3L6Q5M3_PANMI|nr:G-type lectin S-receptor-like serine/threonine-protein kinase SD1-13 [Panicum miliaceum]